MLLSQKENLLAQIRNIEENCEGLENEANASRTTQLNERQIWLAEEKRKLQEKISDMDNEMNAASVELQQLSGKGIDQILEGIKKQRWFRFLEKPKVIFDRNTALLWADLDHFPDHRVTNDGLTHYYTGSEAQELLKSINSNRSLDGYDTWKIPSPHELWNMIEDKTFPYQNGGSWRINQASYWYVDNNGMLCRKDLDINGAMNGLGTNNSRVLPCCHSLVPQNYESNVAPANTYYSEQEKLQLTLNIFTSNHLVPIFEDEAVTWLYRQIYVEKPALLKQLSELQTEISRVQEVAFFSDTFDYHALLKDYDIPAIDQSVIQYQEAVISLASLFLDKLEEYEQRKRVTIRAFDVVRRKLVQPVRDHPLLSEEESRTLRLRYETLTSYLSFDLKDVKKRVQSIKEQGEKLASRIFSVNRSKNSLEELAGLAKMERPSFSLLAENLAYIVRDAFRKIEFFERYRGLVLCLTDMRQSWEASCIDFRTTQQDRFRKACANHAVSKALAEAWYAEWAEKRLAVERAFLSVIEYIRQGHLLQLQEDGTTVAERALRLLQNYRDEVDDLYLYRDGRWRLHENYGGNEKPVWHEKLETEKTFYWRTSHWVMEVWAELLFAVEKMEERIFLARAFHRILCLSEEGLLNCIQTDESLSLSNDIVETLMGLHEQDVCHLLDDVAVYCDGLNQWGQTLDDLTEKMIAAWNDRMTSV